MSDIALTSATVASHARLQQPQDAQTRTQRAQPPADGGSKGGTAGDDPAVVVQQSGAKAPQTGASDTRQAQADITLADFDEDGIQQLAQQTRQHLTDPSHSLAGRQQQQAIRTLFE